jgi:hypothetical protein
VRFAVAQDARGSDPSLATTRNTVNVGLRASGRKALLASTTWSGRIRSGSTRRDRDPHFHSDACGLGHIFRGARQFDRGVLSVPWRFSDAGIPACWLASSLPASENLHKTFAASRRKKRLNSRAQGGSARSFGHSGKTKALDEPFNILRSAEEGLISVA